MSEGNTFSYNMATPEDVKKFYMCRKDCKSCMNYKYKLLNDPMCVKPVYFKIDKISGKVTPIFWTCKEHRNNSRAANLPKLDVCGVFGDNHTKRT